MCRERVNGWKHLACLRRRMCGMRQDNGRVIVRAIMEFVVVSWYVILGLSDASFVRGRWRYVRPLLCKGKAEGSYDMGEDSQVGEGESSEN